MCFFYILHAEIKRLNVQKLHYSYSMPPQGLKQEDFPREDHPPLSFSWTVLHSATERAPGTCHSNLYISPDPIFEKEFNSFMIGRIPPRSNMD